MDLVWCAITPHVPVLSPACKLHPSEESSIRSVLGDGAPPIGQEASSAGKRKALLSFPFTFAFTFTFTSTPPKAKWLNSRQQPSTSVVGGSNPSVATHFRCWEGLGDGFGVVCHHPACTGAFPGLQVAPFRGVVYL